jgi:hypothetical protein
LVPVKVRNFITSKFIICDFSVTFFVHSWIFIHIIRVRFDCLPAQLIHARTRFRSGN